ncbi:putative ATP-grasp-modified RiPP [Streptosporangium subroseum]|uniref:putative ATP-grasp-modified RiPP n=1 Tax=Streptosporangium subroseum TaxID=106412 RepID=UPI00308FF075|nr:putative ATP-grasp-modified RiPP [Streptosporangium subroseum]
MTTATAVAPWGLSRMTEPLPSVSSPYDTIQFDPATQLTSFHDEAGVIVAGATISYSQGGGSDGSKNAPKVADDSNTDG